jgi:hypothetical protein
MNYWILAKDALEGGLIDAYPRGSPAGDLWDLGAPLLPGYPKGASVGFSDNFPDARRLEDFQPNILSALIVSPKVREVLTQLDVPDIEVLPVAIRNHRDEVVGPDHAFINPLGSQEALDMEKSTYRMGALDKTQISRMKALVMSPQRIAPTAKLFRCRNYLTLIMIRDDVREAFERAQLTGYRLISPEGWTGRGL